MLEREIKLKNMNDQQKNRASRAILAWMTRFVLKREASRAMGHSSTRLWQMHEKKRVEKFKGRARLDGIQKSPKSVPTRKKDGRKSTNHCCLTHRVPRPHVRHVTGQAGVNQLDPRTEEQCSDELASNAATESQAMQPRTRQHCRNGLVSKAAMNSRGMQQ
jgi:hypothetical protein